NQYQPRNKSCPCLAMASRGNKNTPRIELQRTATKIVTKLMNWNQYRVGTLLQRVHTDCLGRKFSPQRSQYTVTLRRKRFNPAIPGRLLRLRFQKLLVRGSVLVSANLLAQKFGQIIPRRTVARSGWRLVQCQFTRADARIADGESNGTAEVRSRHSGLSCLQNAGGIAQRWNGPEVRLLPAHLSRAR